MKKILITSFEPFGNRTINKSNEISNLLIIKNNLVRKILLPVTYSNFNTLYNEISEFKPKILIMFGESPYKEDVSIEFKAKNIMNCSLADNEQVIHKNVIIDNSFSEFLETNFNKDLLKKLIQKYELNEHYDAGGYVCNSTYFNALKIIQDDECYVLFIHLNKDIKNNDIVSEKISRFIEELSESI